MTLPPTDVRLQFVNDRDLLRRFVQDADEAAFGEIVQRYQALVLGVCRRVTGHAADVEDAFQATFVALARRPTSIRKRTSLSSWLYTVAWRTSWRLVRQRRKNPVESLPQQPVAESSDPLDQIASAQDCRVLDEELNDLPGKYRDVLVMTYFTQQTSQQIADQIGVSKGTIDGRIREARNMLRVRLARRGVAVGVLAVAAGLSAGPASAASTALLDSTLQLGAQTLSGSVPGTTDLSHLEPLIRPETAMLTTKVIMSGLFCATAIIGVVGMNGLADEGSEAGSPAAIDTSAADTDDPFDDNNAADSVAAVAPGAANNSPSVTVELGQSEFGGGSSDSTAKRAAGEPRYADYPADAAPVEKWLHECLEKPVGELNFVGETPLSEVLAFIAEYYTSSHGANENGPQMVIYPDLGEFSQVGMSGLDDVFVTDINFKGMSLRNVLKHIFNQTLDGEKSPAPLTYVIQDEVLMVTTVDKAVSDNMMFTRVYDVAGLTELDYGTDELSVGGGAGTGYFSVPMGQFGGMAGGLGGGGTGQDVIAAQATRSVPRSLSDLVQEMTSPPCQWVDVDGQGGAIRQVGDNLVVRQTHEGHREVVRLLNLMAETMARKN